MTAADLGCGPGYFTPTLAQLVGPAGKVIAVDLQQGMLERVRTKVLGTELEPRVVLHHCQAERLDLPGGVDFMLAFYMVHEVPDVEGKHRVVLRLLPGRAQSPLSFMTN